MKKFYLKIHENANARVVAVCDRKLHGKVFEKGGQVLDLKKYGAFYKGEEAGENEVREAIKGFSSLNLVGEEASALAVRAGIAHQSQVLEIAGVPQVQVYILRKM